MKPTNLKVDVSFDPEYEVPDLAALQHSIPKDKLERLENHYTGLTKITVKAEWKEPDTKVAESKKICTIQIKDGGRNRTPAISPAQMLQLLWEVTTKFAIKIERRVGYLIEAYCAGHGAKQMHWTMDGVKLAKEQPASEEKDDEKKTTEDAPGLASLSVGEGVTILPILKDAVPPNFKEEDEDDEADDDDEDDEADDEDFEDDEETAVAVASSGADPHASTLELRRQLIEAKRQLRAERRVARMERRANKEMRNGLKLTSQATWLITQLHAHTHAETRATLTSVRIEAGQANKEAMDSMKEGLGIMRECVTLALDRAESLKTDNTDLRKQVMELVTAFKDATTGEQQLLGKGMAALNEAMRITREVAQREIDLQRALIHIEQGKTMNGKPIQRRGIVSQAAPWAMLAWGQYVEKVKGDKEMGQKIQNFANVMEDEAEAEAEAEAAGEQLDHPIVELVKTFRSKFTDESWGELVMALPVAGQAAIQAALRSHNDSAAIACLVQLETSVKGSPEALPRLIGLLNPEQLELFRDIQRAVNQRLSGEDDEEDDDDDKPSPRAPAPTSKQVGPSAPRPPLPPSA